MPVKKLLSPLLILLALLAISLALLGAAHYSQPVEVDPSNLPPLQAQMPTRAPQESWVKLPPLPETATQADYGAEIFRLVCQDCHGDRGQGLTHEFRMTWAPKDRNCWQSKCHTFNHPPDGFELPRFITPIIGQATLDQFETAADLYEYVRLEMPWHNPGSLTDEEYWQLTAFLVRENGVDPISQPLDQTRAASLVLHPNKPSEMATSPTPNNASLAETPIWPWAVFLILLIAIVLIIVLVSSRRKSA